MARALQTNPAFPDSPQRSDTPLNRTGNPRMPNNHPRQTAEQAEISRPSATMDSTTAIRGTRPRAGLVGNSPQAIAVQVTGVDQEQIQAQGKSPQMARCEHAGSAERA